MQNSTPDASLLIVILTYNSAGVVERTVRAAQQVGSQVLVVDSHSADNTRDLATALGCTVVTRAFKHYADQRNWSIQEHGSAYPMLKGLKEVFDPKGIMNFGCIYPQPGTEHFFE